MIDAPPEVILDALADIGSVPLWSSVHKKAEVIDTYPDGRPHHVKVTVKVVGIVDQEVLEFHWGPAGFHHESPTLGARLSNRAIPECGQSRDRLIEGLVALTEGEAHQVIPHMGLLRGMRCCRIAER